MRKDRDCECEDDLPGNSAIFSFAKLRTRGVRVQHLLWESTGTKNPACPDVICIEELIGSETINTMPLKTLGAFRDDGRVHGANVFVSHRVALLCHWAPWASTRDERRLRRPPHPRPHRVPQGIQETEMSGRDEGCDGSEEDLGPAVCRTRRVAPK